MRNMRADMTLSIRTTTREIIRKSIRTITRETTRNKEIRMGSDS